MAPSDVVPDLGSGLGRAVLAVPSWTFARKVIGVEYDPHLYARAVANVTAAQPRLGRARVRLEHSVAGAFSVRDEVPVVYLFNPFGEATIDKVLDRLMESPRRNPRELRLVYNSHRHEASCSLPASGARCSGTGCTSADGGPRDPGDLTG